MLPNVLTIQMHTAKPHCAVKVFSHQDNVFPDVWMLTPTRDISNSVSGSIWQQRLQCEKHLIYIHQHLYTITYNGHLTVVLKWCRQDWTQVSIYYHKVWNHQNNLEIQCICIWQLSSNQSKLMVHYACMRCDRYFLDPVLDDAVISIMQQCPSIFLLPYCGTMWMSLHDQLSST